MASTMQRIADQYEAKATTPAAKLPLPLIENTRLALNIAACDSQALVVAFSSDDDRRRQLQERLRPLAWSDDFIGQFLYVSENRRAALKAVEGLQVKEGVVIVSPGLFGQSGRVLAQVPFDHEPKQLANALSYSAFAHQKTAKDTRSHTSRGRREGVDWKTLLPVTDPGRPPGRRR
jgi:hypothetical protein